MKATPIFTLGSISLQNGGLTNAAYMRANMFAEHCDEIPLLTINYHSNFDFLTNKQYQLGNIDKKVKILNLYRDLDSTLNFSVPNKLLNPIEHLLNSSEVKFYPDKNSKVKAYRVFEEGVYKKYIRFNKDDKVTSIDHFNNCWERVKQDIFDEYGYISKARHMDKDNNPKLDLYYDRSGKCFLTTVLDDKGNNTRSYLHLVNPIEFKSQDELITHWFNIQINKYTFPSIMCEKREHVNIFKNLKHDNLKRYFILHNNHYGFPHRKGSNVDPSCKPLFDNLEIFDKIIVLTNEQKEDIVKEFSNEDKFTVIPHVAKSVDRLDVKVKNNHAVSMGRYAPQKALHEAIEAFKYVVDKIPDATYYIYGYGNLSEELNTQIKTLGLQKNVFLEGFSLNPTVNYQESVCSISTSKYEGLPLALTESLASGTPVVSYNTLYGPNDIIRDGIDGYVVEYKDKKALAKKIIYLMKNSDIREEMSKNALDVLERYDIKSYKEKWFNIFD